MELGEFWGPSRCYSSGGRKGFISGFVENIKQELAKNKEMKESIKKFRDEAKKLEESDALREARRKYKTIESETVKTSEVIKKKLGEITGTVKESLDEVSKSDLGRKIKEGVEEAAKTAKQSAESVTRGGEKLGRTAAFKAISQVLLPELPGSNKYINKYYKFNQCGALISGELDILKDWCYEATYSQLAHPIQQAKALGLQFHSRILDIDNIDLAMGKMMEQGPVLIITFQAQVVMVIKNHLGEVVEGDPDKVLRMLYVWALCRDQDELNPYMAWRLLDISSSSTEQVL
uniref:Tim44-like domain-containing protein n=1 Tax=Serinus canaria TaxID=9135 RepID=A0A8C9NG58_SERCA